MADKSVKAFADSIRTSSFIGEALVAKQLSVCLSGRAWRMTSVTNSRSEGELTLGTTIASMFGALSYARQPTESSRINRKDKEGEPLQSDHPEQNQYAQRLYGQHSP